MGNTAERLEKISPEQQTLNLPRGVKLLIKLSCLTKKCLVFPRRQYTASGMQWVQGSRPVKSHSRLGRKSIALLPILLAWLTSFQKNDT